MTSIPVTVQERIPMPLGPVQRSESASTTVNVSDIIRVLRQRMFLIIFIWLFILGGTAGLTFYLVREYPLYKAGSYIFVESPNPKTPLELERPMMQVELMDRYVMDQIVRIKDEGFLYDVVNNAAIQETSWFRNQPGEDKLAKIAGAHEKLVEKLKVTQVTDTSYLNVSFRTREPKDAPIIVDRIIDMHLEKMRLASRLQYESERQEYLDKERELENELVTIRDNKQAMIEFDIGVPGVTEGINIVGDTWRAYAEKAADLKTDKLLYKAQYENLLGVDPAQIAIDPQTRMMIEQDPEVAYLKQRRNDLEQGLILLEQQGLGENHRQVRDIAAELAIIEEDLGKTIADKEAEVRQYQINQAQTAYLNATQAEIEINEYVLASEAKQRDLDAKLARYRNLQDEQYLKEDQLGRIRDYASQLKMIIDSKGAVRVHRIGSSRTLEPRERDFPKWELMLPAGGVLGLLLGVGLALLLEFVDSSIKTSRDIVRHVHVPILGTVPDIDDDEADIEEIELASHGAPRSLTAEAFRGIRTNLLLSSPAEQQRSVLVTSPKPEEGKTAVAANLAISLAQSGRKVLLVDANFHRPRLHTLFKNTKERGLSSVLIGQARLEEVVSSTDLPNLDILPAGQIPPNPAELLAPVYLREMIAQATERYDQIILDGPPVLLVSDVLVMTGGVNGVILVCRAKTSLRGAVQRAREQLERVNGHIFGAVLNGAQVTRGGYFREQIRSYYDYQPEEHLEAAAKTALPKEKGRDESDDDKDKSGSDDKA